MRIRVFLSGLLVIGLGSAVAWSSRVPASAGASSSSSGAAAAVPLVPQGPTPTVAAPASGGTNAPSSPEVESLQRDLEKLVNPPGWGSDRWSVMVVSLDRGDTLFSHGPAELVAPASNMK